MHFAFDPTAGIIADQINPAFRPRPFVNYHHGAAAICAMHEIGEEVPYLSGFAALALVCLEPLLDRMENTRINH